MLEMLVQSTGSRETDSIDIPLQHGHVFLQHSDQRLNKSPQCKDKKPGEQNEWDIFNEVLHAGP